MNNNKVRIKKITKKIEKKSKIESDMRLELKNRKITINLKTQ